jgi:predicted dehydrogenase
VELDYDLWLGPAPQRAYNEKRVHYLFRFFWDYSGGQQTNFGAHHLDIAQWGLDMDNSGPVSAEAKARFNKDGWFEVPEWTEINYRYANGITMVCGQSQPSGTTFQGEKGEIHVNRGVLQLKINGEKVAAKDYPKVDVKLYASANHHQNWLDCIKSRAKPICDVEIGHRSATVCHLGNIAVRTGQAIAWDPASEQVINNPDAAKLVEKAYRAPWKLV